MASGVGRSGEILGAPFARKAGGVRKQMAQCHLGGRSRQFGEILMDRRIEAQPASLDQAKDRGGGKLLGDRTDFIDGVGTRRRAAGEIGMAIAADEDDPSAAADGDRHSDDGGVGEVGGDGIDILAELAGGLSRNGHGKGRCDECRQTEYAHG